MAPELPPVTVALPLLGDPLPLLAVVDALAARWPAAVDARLVVPAPVLGARDRTVLAALGEDVRVVEVPGPSPAFGALAVAAAEDAQAPVLVLDPDALPGAEALDGLARGLPVEGAALLRPGSAPVLTAAADLPSLHALLRATDPLPPPPARRARPELPALEHRPRRRGLTSVVLSVAGPPDRVRAAVAAVRRGSRCRLELLVVDDGVPLATRTWLAGQRDLVLVPGRGPAGVNAALRAADGDRVVLLAEQTALPRFWAEGLLRVLDDDDAVAAAGPRGADLPGDQAADPGADPDAWRRAHAGGSVTTRRLDDRCLALRPDALVEVGLLDEACTTLRAAVLDLGLRLRASGRQLRVADDVLVRTGPATLDRSALREDLRRLQALHGRGLGDDVLLSAALIVKDEQQALPRCLDALRGVVDEVVVCDTGSSDRTLELAEALGARVVHAPWTGDFAAARNAVLAACRGAWVLSVDADEQLRVDGDEDLRLQVLVLSTDTDAAAVPVRSRSEDHGGPAFEHAAGRLFRRGSLHWVGAVHESLADVRTGRPPVYLPTTGVRLDHDGYLGRVYELRDKGSRNLLLAEKDHRQAVDGGDPARQWKTAYELARALSKHDGTDERVGTLLRQALALMPTGLAHLRCDAHVRLATVLARQQRLEGAEQSARAGLCASPGDAAALLVLGQVLAVGGRHAEALAVLDAPASDAQAVRDLAKEEVDLPLLRARLLDALGRPAEAAAVLLDLAGTHPSALDWPLLHRVLGDAPDGTTTLAGLVAATPAPALAALDGLDDADRAVLFAAVRARGVDPEAHTPAALHAQRLDQVLQGHDPATVEAAALALEDTDPAGALDLWERLPSSPEHRVAQARCLLQLGRTEQAVAAVDGLDVGALDLGDLLVVVALAAAAGDRSTAQALLDGVDDVPDALRSTVDGLATTLGLVV